MRFGKRLAFSAMLTAFAFAFATSGEAAPLAAAGAKSLGQQTLEDWQRVQTPPRRAGSGRVGSGRVGVRDGSRRGGRYGGRHHRHGDGGVGAAAAVGIIGGVMGAIAADAAARQHQDAVRACIRRYGRAYDPASEMVYTRRGAFPCP
ncbi:MAG TPA: hypothetical protein VFQ27_04420 [Xanthobacteraceae bacterium]|nr:hypothetical protein [Xanthobacteraceae bacterium]